MDPQPLAAPTVAASHAGEARPRAAYFVSDSTGITAETLGRALLVNFPGVTFRHHTIPFVDSAEGAAAALAEIDRAADAGAEPIVFHTVRSPVVARVLSRARATHIDLLGGHLTELEQALGTTASEQLGSFHTVGDTEQYFARMRAVEYAIEHDDAQSMRALDQADVIIVAPSRCGKTPTTMYLALQYGLLVANYPLTDDDFPTEGLPRPIAPFAARCFGLTTTPLRLSRLDVRLARAVHARAAPRRRPLPAYAHPVRQLVDQERRGDVGRHHAVPEAAHLTPFRAVATPRRRPDTAHTRAPHERPDT